jgi:hypothetical protein
MTSVACRSAALASCILIGLISGADGAGARTPDPSAPAPSNSTSYSTLPTTFSLTVSPTRLVVGQSDIASQHRILVVNRGESPVPVTVQKRNFTGSPDGTLQFQAKAPYSASNWVDVRPANFMLAPGRSQWVTATITVPPRPEPGDHQVAFVFLVPAGQSSANVKINRGVATPVYITVPGSSNNAVTVSDLKAPGFSTSGRVTLTAKVHDTGNVHRDFRGTTPLKIGASGAAAVFPDFTVTRGSMRNITTTWQPPMMCICHVQVKIANADGTSHSVTVRVIVFPLPQVLAILGGALLLGLLVFLLRRRYRGNIRRAAIALNRAGSSGDA